MPSREEVARFLDAVKAVKHRAILTTCYAAGLRISEVAGSPYPPSTRSAWCCASSNGKGQKDRYVMLSPKLLAVLRDSWQVERPRHWLFPGGRPETPITREAVNRACHVAVRRARLTKAISPHSLRHAFAFTCWKSAPTSAPFNCCSVIGGWRP